MNRALPWKAFFLPFFAIVLVAFSGCGGTPVPKETKAPATGKSSGKSRGAKITWTPIEFPKDVLKELEKNIKEWASKKGHYIGFDKTGKAGVKNQKGRMVAVPISVFPPSEKLPKEVLEKIEARVKEWAESKGYTTGRDKKGKLVGKNLKDKNVNPPFNIFLPTLPDDFVTATGSASTGKTITPSDAASATGTSPGTDDDPGDDAEAED